MFSGSPSTARAGNRRIQLLSALRAHTKAPHKDDILRRTLRALKRPRRARRTDAGGQAHGHRRQRDAEHTHLSRGSKGMHLLSPSYTSLFLGRTLNIVRECEALRRRQREPPPLTVSTQPTQRISQPTQRLIALS
jgi:hypothetical protein